MQKIRRRRNRPKIIITISAIAPSQHNPNFLRKHFYAVPSDCFSHMPDSAKAFDEMVNGFRLRMARKFDIDILQVKAEIGKPKQIRQPPFEAIGDKKSYNEGRAIAYAEWIAKRDGIQISNGKIRCAWSGFYSAWSKRNQRFYGGAKEVELYCHRICAVEWGHEEEVYNVRKDGRRGAWSHNQWVAESRIDIPHWDFEHPPLELCEENEQ